MKNEFSSQSKSKRVTGLPDEREYLFAPYSAFSVLSATWNAGTKDDPHVIELLADRAQVIVLLADPVSVVSDKYDAKTSWIKVPSAEGDKFVSLDEECRARLTAQPTGSHFF